MDIVRTTDACWIQDYNFFVCRVCHCGVRLPHVQNHFKKSVHRYSSIQLAELQAWLNTHISVSYESSGVKLPQSLPTPIPDLPVVHDARQCTYDESSCRYICRNKSDMQKHLSTVHALVRHRGPGRPDRASQGTSYEPWISITACQRLYLSGPNSGYIPVRTMDQASARPVPIPQARDLFDQAMEAAEEQKKQAREQVKSYDRFNTNTWLVRTGWTAALRGCHRTDLLQLIESPDFEAPLEQALALVWTKTVEKCEQAIRTASVFHRRALMRTDKHGSTARRPLTLYQEQSSRNRSIGHWRQILLFFVRTQGGQKCEPTGAPSYRFTDEQRRSYDAWVAALRIYALELDHETTQSSTFFGETNEDSWSDSSYEAESDDDESISYLDSFAAASSSRTIPDLTRPEHATLSFCMALLADRTNIREFDCVFNIGLALLGIDPRTGWREPSVYSSILSGILKIVRYTLYMWAWIEYRKPTSSGQLLDTIDGWIDQHVVRSTCGPVDWMLELRAYAMHITYTTTADSRVFWMGDRVVYGLIEFTLAEFRAFVRTLIDEITLAFHDLIFQRPVDDPLPDISLHALYDDPRNASADWSFLADDRNPFSINRRTWLKDRLVERPDVLPQFVRPGHGGQTMHNHDGIERYLEQVDAFRTKLAMIVHITGGQPARVTELASIRHRNSPDGDFRNIFVDRGVVAVATRYHKRQTATGETNLVHRFVPPVVGQTIVRFLWLVLPFVEGLATVVDRTDDIDAHWWPNPTDQTVARFRRQWDATTLRLLGVRMSVRAYRHLAVALGRAYLPEGVAFVDLAVETGGSKRHDTTLAIDARERQAGHTPYVGELIYGRTSALQTGALSSVQDRYRTISLAWHDMLDLAGSARSTASTIIGFETSPTDVRTALRALYGPAAHFRPGQEAPLQSLLNEQRSPILIVMATGAGKSLYVFLPAYNEPYGVTILIVPLIALRTEFQARCQAKGLRCHVWDRTESPMSFGNAQVVLVTPESAVSNTFTHFLNHLRTTDRLRRIVVDECHLVLDNEGSWRPAFQQFHRFALLRTQLVFLTATLPPAREGEFWKRVGLQGVRAWVHRTTTQRRNLAYSIRHVPSSQVVGQLRTELARERNGRAIVFCPSRTMVQDLSAEVGCLAYHALLPGKDQQFERFLQDDGGIITATNALGLGVDILNVRLVVHVQPPRTLVEFMQESGRAGRDGLNSRVILFVPNIMPDSKLELDLRTWIAATTQCRRIQLEQIFDGTSSRVRCQEVEEPCDVCQKNVRKIKRPGLPPVVRGDSRAILNERESVRSTAVHQVRGRASVWEHGLEILQKHELDCFLCGLTIDQWHPRTGCRHPRRLGYNGTVKRFRHSVRFTAYSACFKCGFPQSECFPRWRRVDEGFKEDGTIPCRFNTEVLFEVGTMVLSLARETRDVRTKCLQRLELADKLGKRCRSMEEEGMIVREFGRGLVYNDIQTTCLFRTVLEILDK